MLSFIQSVEKQVSASWIAKLFVQVIEACTAQKKTNEED
jgi:hypothetical protein